MRIISTVFIVSALLYGCSSSETDPPVVDALEDNSRTAETEMRLMATEGGQMLLRAIEAHGGLAAWHRAETSSYVWGFSGGIQTRMVAHNRTRQVYHDVLSLGEEQAPDGARMVWDGTDAWVYPDSLNTNPRFMAATGYYFQSIPFVLADPGIRHEILAPALLDGEEHHLVRATFNDGIGDASGDHYTLYIHTETYRVNALRYRSTFGQGRPAIEEGMPETLLYYMNYVTVDGLTVPTRFEGYGFAEGARGEKYYEAVSSEHSYTRPFDERRLVMPDSGARISPMPVMEQ